MSDTTFVDGDLALSNRIVAAWLNDVNNLRYGLGSSTRGSYLLEYTPAGTGAVATNVQTKLRLYKSITDYGAATGNSAATNRPLIQAAIDANYGKCLLIPDGTFEVNTAGAIVAPVGNALTITDEITLIFEGIIKGTNNCNIFNITAGSQDVVSFLYEGGGVEGPARNWLSTYASANFNGANIKVNSGIFRGYQIKIINPVQYGVLADSVEEGEICECDLIGGWATYDATLVNGPDNNNYQIFLNDASHGWKIDGNKTLAGPNAEKCSQAIASETLGASGTTPSNRVQVINNRLFHQWEKGLYLYGHDAEVSNNWVYNNANGEGLRTVGKRPTYSANIIRSCVGGGITVYDGEGALVEGNKISDCNAVGIQLGYILATAPTTQSIDNAKIVGNTIDQKTTGSNIIEAIGVRGVAGTATVETGIEVSNNYVMNANYSGAEDRAAIYFFPNNASTQFNHLRCENNSVFSCGSYGIRLTQGVYSNLALRDNKVWNPGINYTTLGGARSGYKFDTSAVIVGDSISGNHAYSNAGTSQMSYGFQGTSSIESALFADNSSIGHVTGGYTGFTGVKMAKMRNSQGTGALTDTFTMGAAATKVISNTNQQAGMRVALFPTNAAAVALQVGVNALYWDGTFDATTFTLKTGAGGAAAGTETFAYEISV